MKSFIINLLGLLASWHVIDLSAESALNSVWAPLVFAAFLISSLLWLIVKFGVSQRASSGGYCGDGDSGGFGGGDGGGGDGGC